MLRNLIVGLMLALLCTPATGAEGPPAQSLDAAVTVLAGWGSSPAQRNDAMQRIAGAGATAQPQVRMLLNSRVWMARRDGLTLAAQLRLPDLEALISTALADKNWAVRAHAAEASASLADSQRNAVRPALKKLTEDPIARVRLAAYQALVAWSPEGPELVLAMSDQDVEVAYWASQQYLKRTGEEAIKPAIRARLIDNVIGQLKASHWMSVDDVSIVTLMKLGPPAADAFYEAAMAEPPNLRQAAVSAIGSRAGRAGVDLMLRFAEDSDDNVRNTAMDQVGRHAEERHAPRLLRILTTSEDMNTRRWAVAALGRLRYQKAVPQMVKLLKSNDHNIRQAVLQALAGMGDRSIAPQLLAMFRNERQSWRRSQLVRPVAELLGHEGQDFLREVLRDENESVRSYGIYALQGLKPDDRLAILLSVIREDDSDTVRRNAINALEPSQVKSAVEVLTVALQQGGPEARLAAAVKLSEARTPQAIRELLAAFSREENVDVREMILNSLGRTRDPAAVPLLKTALGSPESRLRAAAVRALGQMPQVFDDELLIRTALKEEDDAVLAVCLEMINQRKISDLRLLALADKLLKAPDSNLRHLAAQCLGRIETPAAAKLLCQVIKNDDNPGTRSLAVEALIRLMASGKVAPKAILEDLADALATEDAELRLRVVKALGERPGSEIASLMVGVLARDASDVVRQEAAMVIERGADRSILPELLKAAKAEDRPETLAVLIRVLGKLDDRRALPFLKECLEAGSPVVQAAALDAVSRFRDASLVPFYVQRLRPGNSAEVQLASLRVLADWRDRSALPALMLALKADDARVRHAAIQVLSEFIDPDVIKALVEYRQEPAVQKLLATARMKSVGDDLLAAARRSTDDRERLSLHLALAEMGDRRAVGAIMKAIETSTNSGQPERMFNALATLRESEAYDVCERIAIESFGRRLRLAARATVALGIRPRFIQHVVQQVETGSSSDRRFHINLLSGVRSEEAQARLRRELELALERPTDISLLVSLCSALDVQRPDNVPWLVRVALSELDGPVVVAAIDRLSASDNALAVQALTSVLKSSRSAALRSVALRGLASRHRLTPDAVAQYLQSVDSELRLAAIRAVGPETASPTVVDLLAAWASPDDPQHSPAAVEALGRVGGPAARAIVVQRIGGLGDNPPTPELVAAAGALRAEEAVTTLSEWLRAGSVTLRIACLDALVEIGSAPAIRAVEGAFEQTQVDALRAAAARALARSGRKELLPKMIEGLRQAPGLDVRAACADALGLLGGQKAKAALVESLAHDSGLVREHAARALLKLHGGMTDDVQKLADDTDAGVAMVVRMGGKTDE